MFLCKFFSILHKFFAVFDIFLSQICPKWVLWLWVIDKSNQSLDYCNKYENIAQSTSFHYKYLSPTAHQVLTLISFGCRFPIFSTYDRQTDLSFFINIGMVDFCSEVYLWWFKRIFSRKIYFNSKGSFIVRGIILNRKQNNRMSRMSKDQTLK